MGKEEKLAFESLGKHLAIIEGIVKDARNINKQIRDATVAAAISSQRLKDARESREKGTETLSDSAGAQSGHETSTHMESQTTQTEETAGDIGGTPSIQKTPFQESRAMQTEDTSTQSYPGDEGQNRNVVKKDKKKCIASSSLPEVSKQRKKLRTAQSRVQKAPIEASRSPEENATNPEWQTADHRKRKKETNKRKNGRSGKR